MTFPGDVVDVIVERVVPGGDGLGRLGGVVALVSGGLPGDRVRALVDEAGPRLVRGRVFEVLEPGPFRRPASLVCPRATDGSCGGCDWPSALPERHEELKRSLLADAFRRIGKIAPGQLPPLRWHGSGPNYRLRTRLHVDAAGRVGFFAPRSTTVVPIGGCQIVSPLLLARLPAIGDALAGAAAEGEEVAGELRTLEDMAGTTLLGELRVSRALMKNSALATRLEAFDGIRVSGPGQGPAAVRGQEAIVLEVGTARFRVSIGSFFQANRFLLPSFLDEARRLLAAGLAGRESRSTALDLYAGAGFLTRPLLEAGLETVAVEEEPSSAEDLGVNIDAWSQEGIGRGEVRLSRVEEFLSRETRSFDVVVADPPRAGLAPSVRRWLLDHAPGVLFLVSCDPATLARDLKELKGTYRVPGGALLDLFPETHHVETVLLLTPG